VVLPEPSVSGAISPADRCFALATIKRGGRADAPSTISVKQILVRYSGALEAGADITRTRADACLRAEEARKKLAGGADFDDVAKTYSDDKRDLGSITRAKVAPQFADAAFELEPGYVSYVVETDAGFHVIMRTD